jgi:uncharacterized protein (TIGR02246 family)
MEQRRQGPPRGAKPGKEAIMAQVAVNEAVDQLLAEIAEAWNAGDARAYGARYSPDGTFTNTNGTIDLGRDDVVRTAEEAFQGVLAGSKASLAVRKLRLIRPDVAVADLDTHVSGLPAAGNGPGGEVRISQMLVLVEEDGRWWITAQHNAMQPADD